MIIFAPLKTEAEKTALQQAAIADRHAPINPTHRALLPDGTLAGSVSLFSLPLFAVWVSSHLTPRQSFNFVEQVTEFAKMKALGRSVLTLCPPSSPLHAYMGRFGYREHIPITTVFIQDK